MPVTDERQWVKDILDGDNVAGIFLCSEVSLGQARTGRPYLRVKLLDRTGSLECRVWNDAERIATRFKQGDYVRVEGAAEEYRGEVQVKLSAVDRVDENDVDPSVFLPATRCDVDWMWDRLREIVNGMKDPHLKELLNRLLDDPDFSGKFREAPAAVGNHHAWIGGLLEHTLSLIYLLKRITPHYPQANEDLCLVGAVMHDAGKIWEYSWDRRFDVTDSGRLVGHLVLGVGKIREIALQIPGFPEQLMLECQHLVAAHHGQYEFGSPKLPVTLEAMIVHMCDNLDSKVNAMSQAIEGNPETEGRWTGYQKQFQSSLYRGTKPRELPVGFVPLPAERGGREGGAGEMANPEPEVVAGRGGRAKVVAPKDKDDKPPVVRDLFSSR